MFPSVSFMIMRFDSEDNTSPSAFATTQTPESTAAFVSISEMCIRDRYVAEHVILNRTNALNLEDIVWIYRTLCKLVAGLKLLSVYNLDT